MKTAEKNGLAGTTKPTVRILKGRRMVLLEESEYLRLLDKADDWEPALPEPNEHGNYPLETLGVLVAQKILTRRRSIGLTQRGLARRAGIRLETLNRIEHGRHKPNVATIEKIDRALQEAEKPAGVR